MSNKAPRESLADRINSEPNALLGVTYSELTMLCLASVAIWIPGTILLFFIGLWFFSVVVGMIGAVVTVMIGAEVLRTYKRDRPDNFHIHRVRLWWLTHVNVAPTSLVVRDGWWSIGRRRQNDRTKSKRNK